MRTCTLAVRSARVAAPATKTCIPCRHHAALLRKSGFGPLRHWTDTHSGFGLFVAGA
jgi:hypothetical protein